MGGDEDRLGRIGRGRDAKDCHSTGRCVDFYGASADRLEFDVRRDWYRRPVYRLDVSKLHAMVAGSDDRWGDDRHTYFRLAMSDDPCDRLPEQFFGDVYQVVAEQCTLGPDIGAAEFRRADPLKAGTVYHPDHPIPGIPKVLAGRRGHNDHMHFQLGQAFG